MPNGREAAAFANDEPMAEVALTNVSGGGATAVDTEERALVDDCRNEDEN